jgi:flagellar biosynthesis protein FlhG
LLDVVQERCRLDEAASNARGFPVLSIARAMRSLARLNQADQQRLENALTEVISGVDVLLMDAALPALMESPAVRRDCQKAIALPRLIGHAEGVLGQAGVSPGLASGVSLLVVDPTSSGITDSYALIKRLAMENALLQFEIVVNKAPDEQAAMAVFDNMAKVARRNLAAHLEYLGYIPRDDRLRRANQLGMPVVEAFPTAVSAQSYLELAKKVLHLPRRQHEAGGGVRAIIQNLMCQVSQPLRQHGNNATQLAD